jgi:cell wall-associated NlpC family hydrolase
LDTAYSEKVLKSQIIQNVLASMRTARHDQAAVLYANMYCPIAVYPIGVALSDLESYYRAGTFQTGLIKLTQTVSKAETDSKANQDSNKPAPTADSKAKLEANAAEATVKATTNTPSQKAASGSSPSAACKIPALTDVSYLPRQGYPLAKTDSSRSLAGQVAPKSQF